MTSPPTHTPSAAPVRRRGDQLFSALARGAGIAILAVLAGVAIFLFVEALPALTASKAELPDQKSLGAYVWPLAFGTLLSATIAILIAVPLALAVAIFIAFYAPKRVAGGLGALVDLLAAIPSVVYGLWGIVVLGPALVPLHEWLAANLSFLPFFAGPASATGRTMFTVGLVLAVMILPIITAVTREVFLQTPRKLTEAAYGLGATKWEMIRMTVIPFGRPALISASMLGLGRALGETMAVTMILSASGVVSLNLISSTNPSSIAANIALQFPESSGLDVNVLIASGLVLFAITLAVNMTARWVIARSNLVNA